MVDRVARDHGEDDEVRRRHIPLRTCLGCRATRPCNELVRLAVVDGRVVADPGRRLGGRGAWLCPDPTCAERAARRGAFERGWRGRVLPPDLDQLRGVLAAERCKIGGR
jgi:predicted RNA-binding protein YlxR (DUF448 family)